MNLIKAITLFVSLGLPISARSQEVRVVKFNELEEFIKSPGDHTYIINFWATWCSPCVEELPYFEALNSRNENQKLEIVLVSLDFKSQIDNRVRPFLVKNKIRLKILLLDESNGDTFIDKVSPGWSGAIPATLIINGQKNIRQFYERKFDSLAELESIIQSITERN